MKERKQFYDCITDFIFVEDEPEQADVIFVPGGNYPDAAKQAAKLYHQGYAPYILPSGKYSITVGQFVMPEDTVVGDGSQDSSDREEEKQSAVCAETQGHDWNVRQLGSGENSLPACAEAQGQGLNIIQFESGTNTSAACVEAQSQRYDTEFEYLRSVLLAEGVPDAAILREDRATYTYQNAIFSREVLEKRGICARRAILCCQAFHARRSLLYYQEQFPETEFLVCPVVTKGISRKNWMRTPFGIDTVLGEVERCGGQFHAIMRGYMTE